MLRCKLESGTEKWTSIKRLFLGRAILAVILLAANVLAEPLEVYQIKLSAQSVAESLASLSEQIDVLLLFPYTAAEKLKANPVNGEYTLPEALKIMLEGTGFSGSLSEKGVLMISLTKSDDAAEESKLDERKNRMNNKNLLAAFMGMLMGSGGMQQAMGQDDAGSRNDDDKKYGIEEIIVTAQKRAENLQDVPIAISALSANMIQASGVETTEQLAALTPGLVIAKTRNTAAPYLRGVGTQNTSSGDEGSIALYVDGVYYPSPTSLIFSLANVERVEVLKGPQGTLFGRNATGGLIHVVTPEPALDEVVFNAGVSYEKYDAIGGSLYASSGLTENSAADISIMRKDQRDGWGTIIPTGQDNYARDELGVRTKWVWLPTDDTKLTFSADYFRNKNNFGSSLAPLPGSFLFNPVGEPVGAAPSIYDSFSPGWEDNSYSDVKDYGTMLRIEHNLGFATFTSLTAGRRNNADASFGVDGVEASYSEAILVDENWSFQQEFMLQGDLGRLSYTTGLFLYMAEGRFNPMRTISSDFPIPAMLASNKSLYASMDTDSYAAFTQGTYELFDDTNLTLGLRYTRDRRTQEAWEIANEGHPTVAPGGLIVSHPDDSLSEGKLTWRVALDHQLREETMVYLSISRGFKSGVFNNSVPTDRPVKSETLDAFEVGLKSDIFDGRIRVNLAAFYYDYQDIQLVRIGEAGFTSILNAAEGEVKGLDMDVVFVPSVPVGDLNLRLAATLLDTEYKSFLDAPFLYPSPAVCDAPGTGTPGHTTGTPSGGNTTCLGDASGNDMIRAPNFTSSLTADYRIPVAFGSLGISATWQHTSGFYWEPDNRFKQPSVNIVNAQISMHTVDEKWGVRLYARNLLDKEYISLFSASGLFGDRVAPAEPQIFGVGIDYRLH